VLIYSQKVKLISPGTVTKLFFSKTGQNYSSINISIFFYNISYPAKTVCSFNHGSLHEDLVIKKNPQAATVTGLD